MKSPHVHLYRSGFGNAKKKIESFAARLLPHRDIPASPALYLSLFRSSQTARTHTPALHFLFTLVSLLGAWKVERESTRHGRAYTPPVWALPRPYRQLSGRDVTQWGRQCAGQYTPCLLLDSIRPSQGAPPPARPPIRPPSAVDFPLSLSRSPLLESAHPRQLNKHNSWLCRPAVTMRASRKEIPKIRGNGIVRPALSRLPRRTDYADRRAVADLPFTKNHSTRE